MESLAILLASKNVAAFWEYRVFYLYYFTCNLTFLLIAMNYTECEIVSMTWPSSKQRLRSCLFVPSIRLPIDCNLSMTCEFLEKPLGFIVSIFFLPIL